MYGIYATTMAKAFNTQSLVVFCVGNPWVFLAVPIPIPTAGNPWVYNYLHNLQHAVLKT